MYKSKNTSTENGFDVKTRVFLNAATTMTHTPENQNIELKHNMTNEKISPPTANDLNSRECDMQIVFGSPVDPDEQASRAACDARSGISVQL